MNKTTEALKLAEEAFYLYRPMSLPIKITTKDKQREEALAAIREALAEQELQTCNCRWDSETQVQQCTLHEAHVDAIHDWAERAKIAEAKLAEQEKQEKQEYHELTYEQYLGLAKDADILVAHEHYNLNEQDTKKAWVVEYGKLVYAKAWLDGFESIQPVKQEPVATDLMDMLRLIETIKYLRGIAERGFGREIREDETIEQFVLGYVKHLESTQPVKQGPVAWWNGKETAWFEHELCGWQAPDGCTIPLYAAPVSVEAIRAEALEEAAKVCEQGTGDAVQTDVLKALWKERERIAEVIRGLK